MSSQNVQQGFLLLASPELRDPNFYRAVVLIISHDDEGSFGLVINRPVQRALSEVLTDVDPRAAQVPVFQGGPVQPDMLQFLGPPAGEGRPVVEGVCAGAGLDELLEVASDVSGIRAYAGYAGWGGGQLQRETTEGSWIIAPASAEHVFEVPSDELWGTVLRGLGGAYAWISLKGSEPSQN